MAADTKAKAATSRTSELTPIYQKDYYPCIKLLINRYRQEEWTASRQKLVEIIPSIEKKLTSPCLKRREEVILNRLRAGHTNLTHGYLMDNNGPRIPPICEYCNENVLTIKHLFIQCQNLPNNRDLMAAFRGGSNVEIGDVLGEFANVREAINFLTILGISDRI